jgi:hypothetical protein
MVTQELDVFESMIGCGLQKVVAGLQIFRVTYLVWFT